MAQQNPLPRPGLAQNRKRAHAGQRQASLKFASVAGFADFFHGWLAGQQQQLVPLALRLWDRHGGGMGSAERLGRAGRNRERHTAAWAQPGLTGVWIRAEMLLWGRQTARKRISTPCKKMYQINISALMTG